MTKHKPSLFVICFCILFAVPFLYSEITTESQIAQLQKTGIAAQATVTSIEYLKFSPIKYYVKYISASDELVDAGLPVGQYPKSNNPEILYDSNDNSNISLRDPSRSHIQLVMVLASILAILIEIFVGFENVSRSRSL